MANNPEKGSQFYRNRLIELQSHQTKLTAEDTALLHEEAPLRQSLTTALEKFSQGDESQDRIVDEIKKKLKPIERRRAGVASLIERCRNEISDTIEKGEEADKREIRQREAARQQRKAERDLELCKEMSEIDKRILEAVIDLGELLGEAGVTWARVMNHPQHPDRMGFWQRVDEAVKARGLKHIAVPLPNNIRMLTLIGADALPLVGQEAERREREEEAAWLEKWNKENL